jgi:hypothetical protein
VGRDSPSPSIAGRDGGMEIDKSWAIILRCDSTPNATRFIFEGDSLTSESAQRR